MIEVRGLCFAYGKVQALMDISFEVAEGEIMAIIGANGAGKSTLMKSIAGLLKYQRGEILYKGTSLPNTTHKVVKGGIVLVPEGRWIFPNLSVEENLRIGGYTTTTVKRNLAKMYDSFPLLKERRAQRAGTLSGGEQQMLAIGRGLMSEPSVILLDEPSLGLAPIIVNEIFRIIQRINDDGATVLLVEQNARKALSVADHVCLLETGKIVKKGTGEEMINDPHVIEAYLGGKRYRQRRSTTC